MAYSDSSMYPKGVQFLTLATTVPQTIAAVTASTAPTAVRKINSILVTAGVSAAGTTFTVQAIDDSPVYAAVFIPLAGGSFVIPSFTVPDGVEGVEIVAVGSGAGTMFASVCSFR